MVTSGGLRFSPVLHNITPERVVFCYRSGDADSLEVAEYYRDKREVPNDHIVALPCSSDNIISEDDFHTTIEDPITSALNNLGQDFSSSGERAIWVIILGYHIPHMYISSSGEYIAIASRLHRIGHENSEKLPNFTYDRRGNWKYFDTDDANQMMITAVIDGPTKEAAKTLIDRSIDVDNLSFVTGKIYVDPYGKKLTEDQIAYQNDILDWIEYSVDNIGLTTSITVEMDEDPYGDPYRESMVESFNGDSFYWGWFTPRYSRSLFSNQNQRRAFLYNADDDSAADITQGFDEHGSDPWCNIAINLDPGYAACAGAVDVPQEDAYLRPRPFFEAMHRGASLGECFLYSSPVVNWKIILIGDPLLVVNLPDALPIDLDLSNAALVANVVSPTPETLTLTNNLLPNDEAIRLATNDLENAVAWATRQYNILDDIVDNVVASHDMLFELSLLQPSATLRDAKSIDSRNMLFGAISTPFLNYVLVTTGTTFDVWLTDHNEKISQDFSEVLLYADGASVSSNDIYAEGYWRYDFIYTHTLTTLEDIYFRLQVATEDNFSNIEIDVSSFDSVVGWYYEKESFQAFYSMPSSGFSSSFSGRRIRYATPDSNYYLTSAEVYYVRWMALDHLGQPITDWTVDSNQMIVH